MPLQQPSDALEASGHSVTGLDVETPATAPSMSPDTVPSEAFLADASLCLSQISCDDAQQQRPSAAAAAADAAAEEEEEEEAAYARGEVLVEDEEGAEGEGRRGGEYNDDVRLYADEEDDCAAPPPPPAGGMSPLQGAGGAGGVGEEDVVGATVHALCEDAMPRLVLSESCGWSSGVVLEHVLPQLEHTRNTVEVVLVDMHDDALIHGVCATIAGTPGIHALTLVNSGRAPGLGLRGIACVAQLVSSCRHLHALSIMNGLFGHTGPAMQLLGDAVAQSRSLRALNLEANGIDDEALLPLAQALAGQKSILEANLDSNSLSYQGLDILSEVCAGGKKKKRNKKEKKSERKDDESAKVEEKKEEN